MYGTLGARPGGAHRPGATGRALLAALVLSTAGHSPGLQAAAIETQFMLQTSGQSMWGTGSALQLDLRHELLSVGWGNSRSDPLRASVGGIASVETPAVTLPNPARTVWDIRNAACFTTFGKRICPLGNPGSKPSSTITIPGADLGDYGARFSASTYGDIGLELRAQADSGSVDVELPVTVRLDVPDVDKLAPGDTFRIDSQVLLSEEARLRTTFPEVDLGLYLTYDILAEASGQVCIKDCPGNTKVLPTLDIQGEAKLLGFNPSQGISSAFEFEAEEEENDDPDGKRKQKVKLALAGNIDVALPDIETSGGLDGDRLRSSGEDDFLTATLDVDELARVAAGVPFPLGVDDVAFLGGSLSYDILSVDVGAALAATQDFEFTPEVMVSLDLGSGAPVVFRAGDSVDIVVPDGVDALSLKPTYFMSGGARLSNRTGLRIDPLAEVAALGFDFGLDLPGFVNAAGFGDPALSLGPLYSDTFRVQGPAIPVFQQTFALDGFNRVASAGLDIVIGTPDGDFAATLVTGSPVALSQTVVNPGQMFSLAFDYLFESGAGSLEVLLGDVVLATLGPAGDGFRRFSERFDLASFLDAAALAAFLALGELELTFAFDGPTGSVLLLDDIAFAGLRNADFETGDLRHWSVSLPQGAGSVGTTARLVAQAPEPASVAMLLLGVLLLVVHRQLAPPAVRRPLARA